MSSETESLALHLVRALYDSTEGRPQPWRMLAEVDGMTAEAIVFAVARGWTPVGATVAAPSSVEDDGGLSCPPCRTPFYRGGRRH